MFTKQELQEAATKGEYLNTDGIQYDIDGKSLAEHISSLGVHVCRHSDKGRYGEVVFVMDDTLYAMSTNGYVSDAKGAYPYIGAEMSKIQEIADRIGNCRQSQRDFLVAEQFYDIQNAYYTELGMRKALLILGYKVELRIIDDKVAGVTIVKKD